MENDLRVKIVDITPSSPYEKYLYKCITPAPFGKYRKRRGKSSHSGFVHL